MLKLNAEEFVQIHYNDAWWDHIPFEDSKKKHLENVKNCKEALAWHNKKDRPLSILAVHGSGRSSFISCARELSNSQLLLNGALQQFYDKPKEYEIVEAPLRAYQIDYCNNCYATTSALCGFPCDCWPWDDMQKLYPIVLRCDVMFCSTGVNQSAMSSRLKAFMDRLISLDGGFFREELKPKDVDFKDKCVALSLDLADKKELNYDARMWGRAAAYFITSKDQNNTNETIAKPFDSPLNYIELVAHSLRDGMSDYGFFHDPDYWYAGAGTNPNEEMALDKNYLNKPEFYKRAVLVAKKTVELAQRLRDNPPPFDGGGRPKTRT